MSDALTIPTTRDEAWRYADGAALAALTVDDLANWHETSLAEGETRAKTLVLDDQFPGVHRVRLNVAEGARAELFAVLSASAYTRLEVEVTLAKGAHFEFGGVTIGGGDATREIVTRVRHAEADGTSTQVIRAVHWQRATGNFLGRVEVAKDAQKTDAGQDFKGLLLDKGATINAKPELEIFADDVKCAHGAAIGALDERAAYYMASRGIPPEAARKLLVRAFLADAFVSLDDESERDTLLDAALAALGDAV